MLHRMTMGTRATSIHDGRSHHDANGKEPRSMKEGLPEQKVFRMGRNRLAVALFIFHEARRKSEKIIYQRQAYQVDYVQCDDQF